MGAKLLLTIIVLLTLCCPVNAQTSYTVSGVYQSNTPGCDGNSLTMGLVTSGSSPLGTFASGNSVSRSPGSAFRFQDGQTTILVGSLALDDCLRICREIEKCTAVMYQAGCNGGTRSCRFIETTGQLSVTTSSTTATAACTGNINDGSSVYVKYCPSSTGVPTISFGSGTSTDPNFGRKTGNTGTNQWNPYLWNACITTSQATTRRRTECAGTSCVCPTGKSCQTITNEGGGTVGMYFEDTRPCTPCNENDLQPYRDFSATFHGGKNWLYIPDQCDSCNKKYSVKVHNNWFIFDMPCAEGTRYDAEQGECVFAAEHERCYHANPSPPVDTCNRYPIPEDICKYVEYNVERECADGLIFDRRECDCVPGPAVPIRPEDVVAILCNGTDYDAGGYMGSANPFPDRNRNQFSRLGKNNVCVFQGRSNVFAEGLKIPRLSGLGEMLNPSISLWFFDTSTTSNKYILTTNRGRSRGPLGSLDPNFELYTENNNLYFTSSILGNRVLPSPSEQAIPIAKRKWTCIGVVFDHEVTEKKKAKSLRVYLYVKQDGGQMTVRTRTANSYSVVMNSEDMKVSYFNENNDFFVGMMDSIVFTQNVRITREMMEKICSRSPDSY